MIYYEMWVVNFNIPVTIQRIDVSIVLKLLYPLVINNTQLYLIISIKISLSERLSGLPKLYQPVNVNNNKLFNNVHSG